jgi:glucose/arabinose dehydrogenase
MSVRTLSIPLVAAATLLLAGCAGTAEHPVSAGVGPHPTLPPPQPEKVPAVQIAPANPWPKGTAPNAAPGTAVAAFAAGLDHPRWIYVLPNGDVLGNVRCARNCSASRAG